MLFTPLIKAKLGDIQANRLYNKILNRDWFSVRLFVTKLVQDHVGVQLQVPSLNFSQLDTCNWIPT